MSPKYRPVVVKKIKPTRLREWIVRRNVLHLPNATWLIFLFSLLSRIPLLLNDLPPYQFCDETIYQNEVARMISADDWISNEFRAGGFNIYPAYILFNFINVFQPTTLSTSQMLIIGRLFYVILLPALSSLIAFKIANLFVGKVPSVVSSLLFSLSLFHYSNYWYPDTYIHFGILGFIYFALVIFLAKNETKKTYIYLGIFLSIAISTKYTALVLFVPTLFLLFYKFSKVRSRKVFRKNFFLFIGTFVIFTIALNIGALLRTKSFIEGFLFNLNNYGSTVGTRYDGFLFYIAILLLNSFGVFGFIYFIVGMAKSRMQRVMLTLLFLYPIILIMTLGDKKWVLARNMTSASGFLIPIIAIGIAWTFQKRASSNKFLRQGISLFLAASIFIPLTAYGYLVFKDMSTDTRVTAASWISKNIDKDVVVGVNEFCSGSSPAQIAGNMVIGDPTLAQNLDYYVFNSYWSSSCSNKYLEKGVLTLIDQSKIHFEQWNSTRLIGPFGSVVFSKSDLPENYELAKLIRGNGPDIIIIKKLN